MITINANGQILSMCQCDQLVSDSIDVLEVQFVFDNAWAGMVKTAQFTQKNKETQAFDTYNVLIDDLGMAYVPNEITNGVCIISVFGVLGGKRMTTAPLAVSVLKSGFIPDGNTPIPPTPDLYQQLLDEFQASSYELPKASAEALGGVKVGQGLAVSDDGTLSATGGGVADSVAWENVTDKPETFPPTEHKHQAGDMEGLANVATSGNYEDLNNRPTIPEAYELPTASKGTLGGVKVGSGLSVTSDGTLSVNSDVEAAKLGGKAAGYYLSPNDHLTNGYFVQPVNQRGAAAYTKAGYDIDRWRHGNSNLTVEVADGCIRLTNTTTTGLAWQQIIDRDLAGHKVTVAVCQSNGVVTVGSGDVPADAVTADTALFTTKLADETGSVVFYKHATGLYSYRIFVAAGKVMELRWAALYDGAFTEADLPDYHPRGYAAELAECKRYFRRIRAESTNATIGVGMAYSSTKAWINVPRTRMRIDKPTVTISGDTMRIYAGSTASDGTEIAVDKISDSYLRITATISGIANGAAIVATNGATADFYIDEDADL